MGMNMILATIVKDGLLKLERVHPLSHPIPAKGRLSLWEHSNHF